VILSGLVADDSSDEVREGGASGGAVAPPEHRAGPGLWARRRPVLHGSRVCAGESLQERLRRLNRAGKRLSVAEAIGYAVQIVEAAGYAHRQGILHRDIRPANIKLDVHDRAILMDIGMVKISGGSDTRQQRRGRHGNLHVAGGDPGRDTRPALGHLLAGGDAVRDGGRPPPFEASSAMTLLMMHLKDAVPDLREVRSDRRLHSGRRVTGAGQGSGRALRLDGRPGLALEEMASRCRPRCIGPAGTISTWRKITAEPARLATAFEAPGGGSAARPVTAAPRLQASPQAWPAQRPGRKPARRRGRRQQPGRKPARRRGRRRLRSGTRPPMPARQTQHALRTGVQGAGEGGSLSAAPRRERSGPGVLRKWWVWAGAASCWQPWASA